MGYWGLTCSVIPSCPVGDFYHGDCLFVTCQCVIGLPNVWTEGIMAFGHGSNLWGKSRVGVIGHLLYICNAITRTCCIPDHHHLFAALGAPP